MKDTDSNEQQHLENWVIYDVLPELMARSLRIRSIVGVQIILDKIVEKLDGKEWNGLTFKQLVRAWSKLENYEEE